MAMIKIKDYTTGVMLIANDLLSGRTVYFGNNNDWLAFENFELKLAAVVNSEQEADDLVSHAIPAGSKSPVVDPYIIQLNEAGVPNHPREQIRANGPSIRYGV